VRTRERSEAASTARERDRIRRHGTRRTKGTPLVGRLLASALACALAMLSGLSHVCAQSYATDAQHLHPSAMPDSGFATEGGPGLPEWTFSGAASVHYGSALIRATTGGVTQVVLLRDQLVLEPTLALGLPLGFSVQVSLPFGLLATGGDADTLSRFALPALRGQGIGDPRLGLALRHFLIPRDLMLLVSAAVSIPTVTGNDTNHGPNADLLSEPNASIVGNVGLEGRAAILVLRANVGLRGRTGDAWIGDTPPFAPGTFHVGAELTFGGAVEVVPLDWLHGVVEVHGSTAFNRLTTDGTPVELILGARVHPVTDFEINPFAGIGLTEGYGTPAWRVGGLLRFYMHLHDADGDGVGDDADRCPGQDEDRDGFEDDDGCLDADNDGDGVLDRDDACPTVAGLGHLAGCPDADADHDGVGEGDRCPDRVEDADGFEDGDGCPEADNDGDGLEDARDRCPNDAEDRDGFEDDDGCPEPDNDRDGSPDATDRCPREAEDRDGFEDDDGCVEPDNDGDGVADGEDGPPDPGGIFGVCRNLPETAGGRDARDPDGCPDSAVRVDVAARRIRVPPVFFDTDADVIQPRSFPDLQYVAEILEANAWIRRITVEGHTDDTGGEDHNQDLSERRAASVVRFLVEHGVEPARLAPVGFGRSRPPTADDDPACANTRSAACRQAARRVVFVIAEVATDDEAPPSTAHSSDR
jgi:OOP family OmpA-OmpF porin